MTDDTPLGLNQIQIGRHRLDVYPQRHAYLTNRFGKFVTGLIDGEDAISGESFARFLGERAYEALATLIPNFGNKVPEYEFAGYGSQAALDQARARSTALAAVEEAKDARDLALSRADLDEEPLSDDAVKALDAAVDSIEVPDDPYDERDDASPSFPEIAAAFEMAVKVNRFDALKILGKLVDPQLARQWVNRQLATAIQSTMSPSLPSPSGGPTSTTSGPSSPTSTGSADGPIPASPGSQTPISDAVVVN